MADSPFSPAVGTSSPPDPELSNLPSPPRRQRRLAALLLMTTALLAASLAYCLRREVAFALAPDVPASVGSLQELTPSPSLDNRYVAAEAELALAPIAEPYRHIFEPGSFQLFQVVGLRTAFVELRVPDSVNLSEFVPPRLLAGRLLLLSRAGVVETGLPGLRHRTALPEDTWLLIDGSSPVGSRWSLAMVAMFVSFGVWSAVAATRIVYRRRTD